MFGRLPSRALLIELRLLDGRYHGVGDWPPSPFRVFQALVAGAYGGQWRAEPEEEKDSAFRWLERLDPPIIAAPPSMGTQAVTYFVPNNDLDAVGGDPRRVSEIRAGKVVRPALFDAEKPIVYAWPFDEETDAPHRICLLATRLHRLGWGIDAAFARAEVVDWNAAELRLAGLPGRVARPARLGSARDPSCPEPGSLESLKARHQAGATRFQDQKQGRSRLVLFRQPPKPRYRTIAYDRPPARALFELRRADDPAGLNAIALSRIVDVAKAVRDLSAARLRIALPRRSADIDRFIVGHAAEPADIVRRVRFLPLPSIGHAETDPAIRRVMVEIPQDCPIGSDDVIWSVSGQDFVDPDTGEIVGAYAPAADDRMLDRYSIGSRRARHWQTVTPVALPVPPGRRRSSGLERVDDDARAAGAVAAAVRHAGQDWHGIDIRVQAEPFHRRWIRADAFRPDRFAGRLRHVEITFPEPIAGPLIIGDGRWLGLGLFAPAPNAVATVHIFAVSAETAVPTPHREDVVRAFRRAVMAVVDAEFLRQRARDGKPPRRGEPLPTFFTGHQPDGAPARSGRHDHLFFLAYDRDGDGRIDRLAVVAPERADRSSESDRERSLEVRRQLRVLDRALAGLTLLRAGRAGVLELSRTVREAGNSDRVFGWAAEWVTYTPYLPTRHPRRIAPEEAVRQDLAEECARRGLPRPRVQVLDVEVGAHGGLTARAKLSFETQIRGPIVLGRGSHFGSGLFRTERSLG